MENLKMFLYMYFDVKLLDNLGVELKESWDINQFKKIYNLFCSTGTVDNDYYHL